jgi:hypothetical protein
MSNQEQLLLGGNTGCDSELISAQVRKDLCLAISDTTFKNRKCVLTTNSNIAVGSTLLKRRRSSEDKLIT